jgi:hypothetical protein
MNSKIIASVQAVNFDKIEFSKSRADVQPVALLLPLKTGTRTA